MVPEKVAKKIADLLQSGDRLVTLRLEEFFEGNTNRWSIGVNLDDPEHPGVGEFYRALLAIRRRPDVQDVLVEFSGCTEDEPADEWLFTDVVFIVTSAAVETVWEWVRELHPSDIHEGWCVEPSVQVPLPPEQLLPNMRPLRVWWD
jgi:hypothetical protein